MESYEIHCTYFIVLKVIYIVEKILLEFSRNDGYLTKYLECISEQSSNVVLTKHF